MRQIASRFVVSLLRRPLAVGFHRRTGSLAILNLGSTTPRRWGRTTWSDSRSCCQQPDATQDAAPTACLVQPHGHLPRPGRSPAHAQEEGPMADERGPPGDPGEAAGLLRDWPADLHSAGLCRRERSQHGSGDDSGLTAVPRGTGGSTPAPRPLGDDRPTRGLRLSGVTAAMVFEGASRTPGRSRTRRRSCPGTAARRRGDLGQSQAAPVREGGDDTGGRGSPGAVAAVESGPDTPIEEIPKTKNALRSAGKRMKEAVSEAIVSALHDVDYVPEDIAGWFQDRAAYAM